MIGTVSRISVSIERKLSGGRRLIAEAVSAMAGLFAGHFLFVSDIAFHEFQGHVVQARGFSPSLSRSGSTCILCSLIIISHHSYGFLPVYTFIFAFQGGEGKSESKIKYKFDFCLFFDSSFDVERSMFDVHSPLFLPTSTVLPLTSVVDTCPSTGYTFVPFVQKSSV
jgi:hypothetical protein